jgi:acetyl-CoA C-acetyltransferase
MTDAVLVSFARTPLGRAYKGAFNDTQPQELGGHAIAHAVSRVGVDPAEVDDVIMGAALQQGAQGMNLGRQAALRAGLPTSVSGMTVDRQCASGLMSVVLASRLVEAGDARIMVAGGAESISVVQNRNLNTHRAEDPWLKANVPGIYDSMLQTAEAVASRYDISRDRQDAYAVESQRRTAAAQAEGRFDEEIVPLASTPLVKGPDGHPVPGEQIILDRDEGNRPGTTLEALAGLTPVLEDQVPMATVTAGNASQMSDGGAALVVMSAEEASRRGLEPLGRLAGYAVAGVSPDEMGIGPVAAVPKLLEQARLRVEDIDLWELNEAFASQVLYCQDVLGIPHERLNVDGGAISVGHPYGMSGARMTGHGLLAARRLGGKRMVVTMCIGGGMGAAALFERL